MVIKIDMERSLFDLDSLVAFRHWMHQNAENSWKEFNTVAKIHEYLVSNLKVDPERIQKIAGTGFVVTLEGTGPAKGTYILVLDLNK